MAQLTAILYRYRWGLLGMSTMVLSVLIILLVVKISKSEIFSPVPESIIALPVTPDSSEVMVIESQTPTIENIEELQQSIETQSLEPLSPEPTETVLFSRQLAYVERVVDGDTIEVILDGEKYELRYIGIDAPEYGSPYAEEAREANKNLVENQIIEIEKDMTDRDQFGRLLRYVFLTDGRFVNSELAGTGLVRSAIFPPDINYQEVIESKVDLAKKAGLGLWDLSPTPTIELDIDQGIKIQVDPSCSQFNAPGNDNQNKNEEYVCIRNLSNQNVELQDWYIRDDYGWSFYFPAFSLDGNSIVQVFTGCGTNTLQELFWCKDETAVWNNDGDCVFLIDADGLEAAKYCY